MGLGPGDMIAVNLETGEFKDNHSVKNEIKSKYPYKKWMEEEAIYIHRKEFQASSPPLEEKEREEKTMKLIQEQTKFGWGLEDMEMIISDMASTGKESTFSMGDDIPLAVLSTRPHVLYDYFKQRFAQVTNPAIDPLREGAVMSLKMSLGGKKSVLLPSKEGAQMVHLESPVLNNNEFDMIMNIDAGTSTSSTFNPTILS